MEITEAAWLQTEENKRRTLQRNDLVAAVSKNDTCVCLVALLFRCSPPARARRRCCQKNITCAASRALDLRVLQCAAWAHEQVRLPD